MAYSISQRNRSTTVARFDALTQPENTFLATYLWIDAKGKRIRLKTRTFDFEAHSHTDLPMWEQSDLANMDKYIQPIRIFADPFYTAGKNKIVLCESYHSDKMTIPTENKRHGLLKTSAKFNSQFLSTKTCNSKIILKQSYTIHDLSYNLNDDSDDDREEGGHLSPQLITAFNNINNNKPQINGRFLAESHYKACLYAGIRMKSLELESSNVSNKTEWLFELEEFECGIEAGDHLWVARYILTRMAEDFGLLIRFSNLTSNSNRNTIALFSIVNFNGYFSVNNGHDDKTSCSPPNKKTKLSLSPCSLLCKCALLVDHKLQSTDLIHSLNTNTININSLITLDLKDATDHYEINCKNKNYDPYDVVNRIYLVFG